MAWRTLFSLFPQDPCFRLRIRAISSFSLGPHWAGSTSISVGITSGGHFQKPKRVNSGRSDGVPVLSVQFFPFSVISPLGNVSPQSSGPRLWKSSIWRPGIYPKCSSNCGGGGGLTLIISAPIWRRPFFSRPAGSTNGGDHRIRDKSYTKDNCISVCGKNI